MPKTVDNKKISNNNKIDLASKFIQYIMEENGKLKDENESLKNKFNDLRIMLISLMNNQNLNNFNYNNNFNFNGNNINSNMNNNMNGNNNMNNMNNNFNNLFPNQNYIGKSKISNFNIQIM